MTPPQDYWSIIGGTYSPEVLVRTKVTVDTFVTSLNNNSISGSCSIILYGDDSGRGKYLGTPLATEMTAIQYGLWSATINIIVRSGNSSNLRVMYMM